MYARTCTGTILPAHVPLPFNHPSAFEDFFVFSTPPTFNLKVDCGWGPFQIYPRPTMVSVWFFSILENFVTLSVHLAPSPLSALVRRLRYDL